MLETHIKQPIITCTLVPKAERVCTTHITTILQKKKTHLGLTSLATSAISSNCATLSSVSTFPLFRTAEESLRRHAPDAFIRPWHWQMSWRSDCDQYVSWFPRTSMSSSSRMSPNGSWLSARAFRLTYLNSELCHIKCLYWESPIKSFYWNIWDVSKPAPSPLGHLSPNQHMTSRPPTQRRGYL